MEQVVGEGADRGQHLAVVAEAHVGEGALGAVREDPDELAGWESVDVDVGVRPFLPDGKVFA